MKQSAGRALALLLYTLVMWLLQPLLLLYLLKRARKQPEYLQGWAQRFAAQVPVGSPAAQRIWVHAVSVGETHAISPLVRQWAARHPETVWVFSSTTPTGQATARQLFADLPGAQFFYMPYDLPHLVRRCIRRVQAGCLWLVETELWPHLLRIAPGMGLQVSLLNARVSPRTAKRLRQLQVLSVPALASLHTLVCQTTQDAEVFASLGRKPDAVVGNLKFDVQLKPEKAALGQEWRAALQSMAGVKLLVMFASSREGEEHLLAEALGQTRFFERLDGAALWLVPRHPQRFDVVHQVLCDVAQQADLGEPLRRSSWGGGPVSRVLEEGSFPHLILGDSMAEMPAYYSACDVALLGGSWLPLGGQNLIEACAYGCPVWMGPHTFNFDKAAEDALQADAARRFSDLEAALEALIALYQHESAPLAASRERALAYAQAHRGATQATMDVLERFGSSPSL